MKKAAQFLAGLTLGATLTAGGVALTEDKILKEHVQFIEVPCHQVADCFDRVEHLTNWSGHSDGPDRIRMHQSSPGICTLAAVGLKLEPKE